jgi:hypothetical protein
MWKRSKFSIRFIVVPMIYPDSCFEVFVCGRIVAYPESGRGDEVTCLGKR